MACPQRVSSAKAICPSLPLGDGLQLFSRAGKGPSGPRDPFAQLEFLIFHASLRDRSVPPPDLDLPVRRLWRLLLARHARAGHRACGSDRGARGEWCTLDMREWCFRSDEPPPRRRAAFPSLHGPPAALLGRWHSPGAFPMDLVDSQTKSDRLQLLLDRRCPWPGAEAHSHRALLRRRGLSEDATWLILPVVICLSQRLSHACVSMNKFRL
ncbi:hypothetical protein H6P81_021371 [Aristolochia fimbriata]|uniref:Uncharacterized protein n=1 Tax=Aristolochia fimbriata TaxID=158543 RepID=A0AAV7DQ36_ARIFI|nr:hypothetical protein H6P81_021371 [Aristolochia fimbriata]